MWRAMPRHIAETLGPRYPWPGNVRKLEQGVRRILLKGRYEGDRPQSGPQGPDALAARLAEGSLDAREVLSLYCALLYDRLGTYEGVARVARLDRRTVRSHVERARGRPG